MLILAKIFANIIFNQVYWKVAFFLNFSSGLGGGVSMETVHDWVKDNVGAFEGRGFAWAKLRS